MTESKPKRKSIHDLMKITQNFILTVSNIELKIRKAFNKNDNFCRDANPLKKGAGSVCMFPKIQF
jgi:hypothetical protein